MSAPRRSSLRQRVPQWLGTALFAYSLIALILSLSPTLRVWLETPRMWLDYALFPLPDTNFAWAVALGLLAGAITARKRIGWAVLMFISLTLLVGNSTAWWYEKGVDSLLVGSCTSFALTALLVWSFPEFYARVRRAAFWKAAIVLVGGLAAAVLLGWGLVEVFPGSLAQEDRLPWVANRVLAFGAADNSFFSGRTHWFVSTLLGLLGALVLLVTVWVLFRSQQAVNAMTAEDDLAIRGLIRHFGEKDSLAYFATRRDKSVVYAPTGRAALTYRVEIGVCLASGDPIGDRAHWAGAIQAWLDLCRRFGWAPAVMGASREGAEAFAEADLKVLHLGDEAVLDTDSFSLTGSAMSPVRQAVTRARRVGVTVQIDRHRDVPAAQMREVIAFADDTRDTDQERGFSMALGRLGDPADGDCLLVRAFAPGNDAGTPRLVGVLSLVPWGGSGASLDLMRRSRDSINGLIELMVTELCQRSRELGVRRVSLNFAVFRSAFEQGEKIGAGPVIRMWRAVLVFFSRYFQLESLYRSNAKFDPEWVPRFLCFDEGRTVAQVGVASGIAEGFVSLPRLGRSPAHDHTGQYDAPGAAAAASLVPELDAAAAARATLRGPEPEQVRVRIHKAEQMQSQGRDPWPEAAPPSHTIVQALAAPLGTPVSIAGRVVALRELGGVVFAVLRDWSGEMQVLLDRETAGEAQLCQFVSDVDLGDLIQVDGHRGDSRRGEPSILVTTWRMNAKSLHPLPSMRHGLADAEARVRQRHVDLAINERSRELLIARSAVLRSLRDCLQDRGFLEVETPILQQIHGGANARPFETHINAYHLDLFLRIAPELYLKRLCVGGMDKVFEIGRTFRNEGVDATHNPEFTMLEAYEAYGDYLTMMRLCRELIQAAAIAVHGRCVMVAPDGTEVDVSGEWPVKTIHGAVSEELAKVGVEAIHPDSSRDELVAAAQAVSCPVRPQWDAGQITLELYEHLVESQTTVPTFYTDFPVSVSPLTRSHRSVPGVTERWDLVAWGIEVGTAYSELTDPLEQRRRLTAQSLLAAGGDPEAMEVDDDFLKALEFGMPPTGGLGVGVDRLVMLITGGTIRETLAFPLARPRE